MQIHNSKYWTINFDETSKIINPEWNEKTAEMTDSEYKAEMEKYTELVEEYKPQKALIDCLQLYYVIPPKVQEWTNTTLFPRILGAGVNKVAILFPEDIITQLSLEQVMEEVLGQKFVTNYFSDKDKAKEWL